MAVDGKCRTGQSARSQWKLIGAVEAVFEPPRVTQQHFEVCQQIVRIEDWLRRLEMREAGYHGLRVRSRLPEERFEEAADTRLDACDGILHVQTCLRCHKIVSASPRPELVRHAARLFLDTRHRDLSFSLLHFRVRLARIGHAPDGRTRDRRTNTDFFPG